MRAIAGYVNVKDLAAAIGPDAGLGERTLRKLESGESPLRPPAMREIAQACGLPYEFFTVDFQRLPDLENGPNELDRHVRENSRRLNDLEEAVRQIPEMATALRRLNEQLEEQRLVVEALGLAVEQRSAEAQQPGQAAQ